RTDARPRGTRRITSAPNATWRLSAVRPAGRSAISTQHRAGAATGPPTTRLRRQALGGQALGGQALGGSGRTATPTNARAGRGIGPSTITFRPRGLPAAGRVATPIKRRVGEGTVMTNIPVGMIVASSTEPHARTIA